MYFSLSLWSKGSKGGWKVRKMKIFFFAVRYALWSFPHLATVVSFVEILRLFRHGRR